MTWVGTQSEKTVTVGAPKMTVATLDTPSAPMFDQYHIPVKIGSYEKVDADAYFFDDAGNKLTFTPDGLSTSHAAMLMVTGGEKVTLTGKKTSKLGDGDDPIIMVEVRAEDDGGLKSVTEKHVLNVKVDEAPTVEKLIGTHVIKFSAAPPNREVVAIAANGVGVYFKDDRNLDSQLVFYAWSSDPKVAYVKENPMNMENKDLTGLTIVGVTPGPVTIMVKAREMRADESATVPGTPLPGTAGFKQSVVQSFQVVVQL